MKALSLIFLFTLPVCADTCTYNTWEWHAEQHRSVNHRIVKKKYSELSPDEKDPRSDCTVCREDQSTLEFPNVPKFQVCKHFKDKVTKAIQAVLDADYEIKTVIAYRVGKSRGPVDENGLRSLFSNHSYGTAIDINAPHNGLYKKCKTFGPECHLSRGGPWAERHPLSITKDSVVYQAFRKIGWRWGGELPGEQKDFMHFSLNGY